MTDPIAGTARNQHGTPLPPEGTRVSPSSAATRIAVLLIILVTSGAFAPSLRNDFVSWDDDYVLVDNTAYRGLSAKSLTWMFTTGFTGHYQPLTWLSYAIDAQIWGGVNAFGFHLTNLLLHVATSVGFFLVARRLIMAAVPDFRVPGRAARRDDISVLTGAVAAALLFAVHPLRTESVAWATERRDVLSGAWLMIAALFYLSAAMQTNGPRLRRRIALGASLACYVLSLLSKASGISLPVVLVLLDIYPLRRFAHTEHPPGKGDEARSPSRLSAGSSGAGRVRAILWEKPLFVVPALLSASLAIWAQGQSGALRTFEEHPIAQRVGQACYGIVFYIWKTLWPAGLIPLYEQDPHARAFAIGNVLSAVCVVVITWFAWARRRRLPGLLIAWAVYLAFLTPVLGLAQSGPQLVADRYSYLSCLPWAVLVGAMVTRVLNGAADLRRHIRIGVPVAVAATVVILVALTSAQTRIWADSETLWKTVLARAPDTGSAHANLAVVLNDKGEYRSARDHSLAALAILPGNLVAHGQLGRSSAKLGDLATAEKHLRIALTIRPDDPGVTLRLASVAARQGRPGEAEELFRRVIQLEPDVAAWRLALAGFLAANERYLESEELFEQALRLDPTDSTACFR
ncbi:MAG: tetratricopeptide repeat protein, partial [Phycisphaerae bacterium]